MFALIIACSATEGPSIGCMSAKHKKFFYYAEMRPEAVNALLSPLHLVAKRPWDLQIKAAESWVSSTEAERLF